VLFASFVLAVFMGVLIIAGITATGHTIDMALMHFMLFYAGVFALIGLTTAVGVGLLASDRIVMTPSGRIIAQAVHRAVSFGAVGFLLIHIVTETIAGRTRPPTPCCLSWIPGAPYTWGWALSRRTCSCSF
jgi:hypothetical protein